MRRQSEQFAAYRAALARLAEMGLVYPSFESRTEIARLVAERERSGPWPRDPDGAPLYPGRSRHMDAAEQARRITSGAPYALRLDMTAAIARAPASLTWVETGCGPNGETGVLAAEPAVWGDVVLARKETPTSYHLSVVIDDAAQGATHVVRGQDLFAATSSSSSPSGAAWPPGADLSAPPPDPRCRRAQARQVDRGDGALCPTGARGEPRGDPADDRPLSIPTIPMRLIPSRAMVRGSVARQSAAFRRYFARQL